MPENDQLPAEIGASHHLGPTEWHLYARSLSGWEWSEGPSRQAFPVASVTKMLFAYAIGIAVEEGSVAYEQAVGPPGATLADLMAHTSGLPFIGRSPIARPRTRRIYSNSGVEVAGDHLRRATSIKAPAYVTEAVVGPLDLATVSLTDHVAFGASAGACDLVRFGLETLRPSLIASATMDRITTPWCPDLDGVLPGFGRLTPNPWGLGFELRGHKSPHWTPRSAPATTYGHFGQSGAFLWCDPSRGLACAFVGNSEFSAWHHDTWPQLGDEVLRRFDVAA